LRAALEALRAGGLTELIGREEELELLLRRWSKAKTGQGQRASGLLVLSTHARLQTRVGIATRQVTVMFSFEAIGDAFEAIRDDTMSIRHPGTGPAPHRHQTGM
jgi:hypothetical protein